MSWRAVLSGVFLLALMMGAGGADAAIYKWVDDNGTITYRDTPPPAGKQAETVTPKYTGIEVSTPPDAVPVVQSAREQAAAALEYVKGLLPGRSPAAPPVAEKQAKPKGPPAVDLYVTSWCGYCRQARAFLRSRGVSFREYDIERDAAAARRVAQLNQRGGVPVAVIDDQVVVGFSPSIYEQALAR